MNSIKNSFSISVIAGLLLFSSCSKKQEEVPALIRPVRCQKVTASGIGLQRSFSGVSKAAMEVKLSFKVGGTVRAVKVKIGDKIKKGDMIASLDKNDYRLMYEQATVALANARVQMQSAKSAFERTAALYENNNISLHDFEQVKAAYAAAKAAVESAERSRQLAQSQLHYTNLTAPMAGIVAEVHIEKNENVGPGQLVAELNSGNDIEVTIGIPEGYISRVHAGDKALVVFSALEGKQYEGVISEVSYGINSTSSTYPVSIVLTNPSGDIRPGMAVEATLDFSDADSNELKIIVPLHTVSEDQGGRFVYTVKETGEGTGTIRKQAVSTGAITGNGIEITEGLTDGCLIVTAGISKLAVGMTVKISY